MYSLRITNKELCKENVKWTSYNCTNIHGLKCHIWISFRLSRDHVNPEMIYCLFLLRQGSVAFCFNCDAKKKMTVVTVILTSQLSKVKYVLFSWMAKIYYKTCVQEFNCKRKSLMFRNVLLLNICLSAL